uniref:CG-1 domain-containing protein n=1 Tax=Pygocentrus nattereri TaxID=42514 RepID=A0A3B4DYK1_PYGNA
GAGKETLTDKNNRQMKVFLPNKLLECLPRTSTLPKERLRWNTNEEIASYLISFDRHEEWLSCTLKTRPQNGSIFLYNRKKVQYRKDGYCWKKRKDGKTTREDHMKLKVQGTECLYGCYVHSSIVPTFHRRCYWLLQNPDIVLVHYLNVPSVEDSGKACGPVLCAVADRRDGLRWSRDELISQLKPMFHSMKWSCGNGAELSIEQLVQQILESQQTKPQPRTHTCLCNHGELGSAHLSLTHAGGRIVLSPVPPKPDTPSPPTAASPPSPAPPPHSVSPSQGVATLSLTLLQSPVIGGLLLTDRILSDASGALLRPPSPSPSLMAPPPPATDSPPAAGPTPSAPLPFDPDSFLNSPKQGQTYGGSSLTPPNQANNPSASCRTPPPSSSPQPPSLALSLSPISPPSSLSSLSPPTSTPSSSSLSPSLSFSLSPSCPARSLPPLCLDSSLGLDSLTRPLSPALGEQGTSSPLDAAHQRSASRYPDANGQALLIGRENGAPVNCLPLFSQGGVKVLITGPWSEVSGRYSCMFDQSIVPASLIQPGVLRCYCPAHEAGLVALRVMKDMDAVSSSVLFEYRARNAASLPSSQLDWLSLDDNQFRMSILERLEQMERRMAEMANNNQQQHQQQQNHQQRLSRGGERLTHSIRHRGMTLLHLAAAQGYTQLIHTLIQWRTVSADSLDLEQEVDPLNVDHFSCTPLMWACALGHQSAAVLLYRWSSVALGIPDSLGRLPLAVARSRGHTRLARCIEELLDTSPPPQIPLSSSSIPSPSEPPSPSPSSAYSSGSVPPTSPLSSPPDPMDTSSSSPSSPVSWEALGGAGSGHSPPHTQPDYTHSHTHSPFEAELLNYSENAENEDYLPVDMATLAEQIIEATPERIKQEEFPREAESPLRERRDNPAIHDTMPWLAPYLDTVDRCMCPTPQPPSPLSALALQRLRPPSSAAWAEFLNASANGRMERDFALLTLTDSEQRELYEAARIIQNAFRRYKGRRLKEQQDMAAAVIQRCYRKYKQYALYKKMTQAAILIQSKFRSYYEQKKFQQSRRAAVLIQQYYRSYKEYERLKQGPRGANTLTTKIKGSFLTKKQDQAARKIMRFLRRCRHRYTQIVVVHLDSNDSVV